MNWQLGEELSEPEVGAPAVRRSRLGRPGHLVYGPYAMLTPGVYEIGFVLARGSDGSLPEDQVCATLDAVGDLGHATYAKQEIRCGELGPEMRTFKLLFVLRDIRPMEFRIYTTGAVPLLFEAEPRLVRVSGILDEPLRDGLQGIFDQQGAAADTRRILRLLQPHRAAGVAKVRIGRDGDGGYICPDVWDGFDTAFSFGINDDISWDLDVAARGLRIYQFDHTVSDPAPHDDRMIFEAKRIDTMSGEVSQALGDLVRRHDKGLARPNIILKTDIEGAEWDVFGDIDEESLGRIAWITGEFHYFQGLAQREYRHKIDVALQKLARQFAVVHVHANVSGGVSDIAGIVVPNVIELTWVNRRSHELTISDETFPGPLDQSCNSQLVDLCLGAFRF